MPETHGLLKKRPRTCEHCRTEFEAKKASARFCSPDCTRAATRYGRHYGHYEPRALGVTKS